MQGCLTWEARKCCDLLDLLLPAPVQQQQHGQAQGRQQHHSSAPPEQHVHQQRGRRSQAWEEWAEHQLHEEADGVYDWAAGEAVQPAAAAATTEQEAAVGAGHAGGWLWHVFHPHLPGHGHHGHGHAGSSWAEPELGAAATVASLSRDDFTSDAGSCAAAGPRGLVFCYANDLSYFTNWSHHGYVLHLLRCVVLNTQRHTTCVAALGWWGVRCSATQHNMPRSTTCSGPTELSRR